MPSRSVCLLRVGLQSPLQSFGIISSEQGRNYFSQMIPVKTLTSKKSSLWVKQNYIPSFNNAKQRKRKFYYSVVYLPKTIIDSLPKGRIRTRRHHEWCTLCVGSSIQKDGSRFIRVCSSLRKSAKIKAGDKVEVIFKLIDKDEIEMSEELEAVLKQEVIRGPFFFVPSLLEVYLVS